MTNPPIKILSGTLDEQSDGEIVLRGILDMESLDNLRTDDYQREVLVGKGSGGNKMVNVINDKVHFPDIELGMRGQKFDSTKDGVYVLHNPVYIIDGLQRTSAIKAWRDRNPNKKIPVSLGVKIHFGTTYKEEKALFTLWNGAARRRVSPNILLRNERDESEALMTLYALSMNDPKFPLHGRVTWTQNAQRIDLITAMNYAKAVSNLTRRFMPKNSRTTTRVSNIRTGGYTREMLPQQLNAVAKVMTLNKFRQATIRFYELIEECWGLKNVTYSKMATHLKGNFLLTLASILSDHDNFWKGADLVVDRDFRKKLKSFNITDPTVMQLAAAGHMAIDVLYKMMVKHLDSRRHEGNRLEKRK